MKIRHDYEGRSQNRPESILLFILPSARNKLVSAKTQLLPVHDQTTRNVSSQNMYAFSSLQINKIQQNKLIFALRGLTHRSRVLWPYIVDLLIQIICGRHKKHMNIQNYVATAAAKHYRKQHTVESELK